MTFPSKKKLVIALVILVSVCFNVYIFGMKYLDTVRMEGFQIAVMSIIETAQTQKQVNINYQDKDGKPQSILLVVPSQEETKK